MATERTFQCHDCGTERTTTYDLEGFRHGGCSPADGYFHEVVPDAR